MSPFQLLFLVIIFARLSLNFCPAVPSREAGRPAPSWPSVRPAARGTAPPTSCSAPRPAPSPPSFLYLESPAPPGLLDASVTRLLAPAPRRTLRHIVLRPARSPKCKVKGEKSRRLVFGLREPSCHRGCSPILAPHSCFTGGWQSWDCGSQRKGRGLESQRLDFADDLLPLPSTPALPVQSLGVPRLQGW